MTLIPRAVLTRTLAAALAATLIGVAAAAPARAAAPTVEQRYGVAGPWAVSSMTVDTSYVIRYPRDLGAGGTRHPIVTWGTRECSTSSRPGDSW
jgi:hypothetical protein